MKSIIEDLETEVEYWRGRAEAAEAALGMGGSDWDRAVSPLALQPTRVMRLLAARDMTCPEMVRVLAHDYPNITQQLVRTKLSQIRLLLPWDLMPTSAGGWARTYSVKDRPALVAFLATGVLSAARAA
jgi:hypothetical protein